MTPDIYRIVVAEDEELLLHNLIQKIAQCQLSFEIAGQAQTGAHALELVKTLLPDLLITDIKMPIMSGIELIEQVHLQYPTVRTMIISGFSDFEFAKKAISFHVESYLLKPIDAEELKEALFHVRTQLDLEREKFNQIFCREMTANNPAKIAELLKEFILQNYTTEINLNSIAQYLSYSPSYLTKIFLQAFDTTPNKYVIALRIQQAQFLLTHNPELSIRQIGELTGYPEQGYFSRVFKKQTGVSPFDYREKMSDRSTLPTTK